MAIWVRDHVLPGLIVAVLVGASHFRLKRHVSKVADEQTREIKGGSDEGGAR